MQVYRGLIDMLKDDKSEGFFRPVHARARTELSDEEWDEFQNLTCATDRVKLVFRLPALQGLNLQPFFQAKCSPDALRSKEEGNREFSKGHTTRALHLYSQSILKQPSDTDEGKRSMAIALGNRSAALFRMSQWSFALSDIAQAFEAGFPPELRFKLLERRARCLLQLGGSNLQLAKEAASQALQALPQSNMPSDKMDRWDADLHSLLCSIEKARQSEAAGSDNRPSSPIMAGTLGSISPDPPNLTGGPHEYLPAASRLVQMKCNEEEGRYVTAAQPLRPGDTILVEKAFASVLMNDRGRTHCPRCFQGLVAPTPCNNCCNVIFCSPECCIEAMSTWHKHECKIQSLLAASGMSLTCYLALRLVTQTPFETLLGMRSQLTRDPSETSGMTSKYEDSYVTVYKLLSHEERRTPEDFFHRCLMAAFLIRCLRLTTYFPENNSNKEETELTSNEVFIANVLVHFLQVLQFNAHEIAEFQMPGKGQVDGAQSMRLGAAIYPTLALFNHSCEPSIVRYFTRNTVVVRAVRNIAPGDSVSENYGPLYTQMARRDRQTRLFDQYWFVCKCRACVQDWPTFANMKAGDSLRFRCTNPKCAMPLGGSASADESPTEVVMKCKHCGRSTSMLKGLLALQKTETLFNNGVQLLSEGRIQEAVPVFCRNLYLLDSILVPPYRDYHLCQEALRKCLLSAGNVRVASFSFAANGHKGP